VCIVTEGVTAQLRAQAGVLSVSGEEVDESLELLCAELQAVGVRLGW
jgi:hypothetical protein